MDKRGLLNAMQVGDVWELVVEQPTITGPIALRGFMKHIPVFHRYAAYVKTFS